MRKSIIRILGCLLLAAVLAAGCACAAGAEGENETLLLLTDEDGGWGSGSLQSVNVADGKVYLFVSGLTETVQVTDLASGQTESYDLTEMQEQLAEGATQEAGEETPETGAEALAEMNDLVCCFPWKGGIYAVVNHTEYSNTQSTVDGGHVRRIRLEDGKGILGEEDELRLDWTEMTETAGSWTNSRYISGSEAFGDRLYATAYSDTGDQNLIIFDLTTGEMTERMIPDLSDFTVTADGTILTLQYRWGEESEQILSRYDPESEETEELVRFRMDDGGSVSALAVSEDGNTLYFVRNGEIFEAPGRDLSQARAVNASPCSNAQSFAPLLPDGRMLIWSGEGAFLRSTDPSRRANVTLRLRPYSWGRSLDNASNAFAAEHPEIELVREDYGDESTLLQAMMNQDGTVDVYVMARNSSAFSALYDRGFLADLSGDAGLTDRIGKIYPHLAECLYRDGKLVAVPAAVSGDGIGLSAEVLTKMGLTEADLPRTWDQFFDFLGELPSRMEGTNFRAFELYTDRTELKRDLLNGILNQYALCHPDEPFLSDTALHLLERINQIDCDALGILTEEDMDRMNEEGAFEAMGGMKEALMNTYTDYALSEYSTNVPLILALGEDEEAALPLTVTVAFVNPYSAHAAEAQLFLETVMDHLNASTRYALRPDLNEPLRYPTHEEQKKNLEKWLNVARKNVEEADEEQKASWEEIITEFEKELAEFDEKNWLISPDAIAHYRQRAEHLRPAGWDYFSLLLSAEGGDQFMERQTGFLEGSLPARELLSFMDKKIQMMRLEGN